MGLMMLIKAAFKSLGGSELKREYEKVEKLEGIQKLSWECNDLYRIVSRKLDKSLKNKAAGIIKQKNDLMEFFKHCCNDPIKQTIIEQALKLVNAYFSLISNYSLRSQELSSISLSDLAGRINYNNRKLGSLKSYEAVLELTKTIEMDEKLLRNLKEEKEELERISVRLDYIESTIGGFKHQIISTDSSDPAFEEIEDVINEAAALDTVLSQRSKSRLK